MQARRLTLAALSSGVFIFAAHAAPITSRYRIEQKSEQEVDPSALGQPKQTTRSGSKMYVTLTLNDSAAGRTAHLVIDSAVADTGAVAAMMQGALDSLRGQAFHAFLADGKATNLKAMKEGAAVGQMGGVFNALSPRVKRDVKVGAVWIDTTDSNNEVAGGNMKSRTVTSYKAAGMETRDGVKAMRIDATGSSALSGTNQGMTFEGTGNGTGTYYMAPDGHLLSSTATSNSTLAISIPQAPEPIPLSIKTTLTVSSIR